MARILLLMPSRTYRARDFLAAARAVGVEVVLVTDRRQVLAARERKRCLLVDFHDPDRAARAVVAFARSLPGPPPVRAIVPTDEATPLVAALAAAELGLPHNPAPAVAATRDKARMREAFSWGGCRSPRWARFSRETDPAAVAGWIPFPCVLKPLALSGSRGVIRADDPAGFVAGMERIGRILDDPDPAPRRGEAARRILVEEFIPGAEVALEGLVVNRKLRVLALFDKPDPLDGPFFEETLYVTPSRLPAARQTAVVAEVEKGIAALGLREGPLHAELRLNDAGPWLLEIAARSIGGLCSRALRFGAGVSLEELLLRHALDRDLAGLEREPGAAGALMLPIPRAGVLRAVRGLKAARAVPGVEAVTITIPRGERVVPLPEGSRYLGFLLARADTPAAVETALRTAHERLIVDIVPPPE